jgi:alpha-tubulin suppressor-like RCC1 family protein
VVKRFLLFLAASLALLVLPGAALSAGTSASVLSICCQASAVHKGVDVVSAGATQRAGSGISAHLNKTSFTASQASSVKLVYRFTAPSKKFSYLLTRKMGSKWLVIKSVKKVKKAGTFKGTHSMTVKRVFAGKSVKLGNYRLRLTAIGSKLLAFRVVETAKKTTITASPPVNTSLPVIFGMARQGQSLSASDGSWSHNPTSYSYQWRQCDSTGANCTDISGATTVNYVATPSDVSHTLRLVVTATNSDGSTSATSDKTGVVVVVSPIIIALPVISGTAQEGQALSTSNGSWIYSPTSYSYRWLLCDVSGANCTNISGATNASYVVISSDVSHTLRIVVTATNLGGSTSVTLGKTSVVIALPPANTALPVISGTAQEGRGLSTSYGSWAYNPISYAYQWRLCDAAGANCTNISGATNASYVAVLLDVSHTLCLVVTATNSGGSTSATSDKTGVVTAATPLNTALPVIAGTVQQGQTLSTSNGSWSYSPTSYAYQWRSCDSSGGSCSNISGATNASYVIPGDASSSTLRVVVTATNSVGPTSATSAASGIVQPIVTAISTTSNSNHTCALLSNHTIKCWGSNDFGELGDGTITDRSTPVLVSGISTATAISAGDAHTCALLSGGTVKCWGYNFWGQLGDGTNKNVSRSPVLVSGISTAIAISAGAYHTCALLSGGQVECWGDNEYGKLGDGTITDRSTPVLVSGISTATAISAGNRHTCALLSGGTVKCWGLNYWGQLGDGTTTDRLTPVSVSGISTATAISAANEYTCALLSGGQAKCWGYNVNGQLGDGVPDHGSPAANGDDISSTPVSVSSISTATAISAGSYLACALLSGGTAKCWGDNSVGQLGDGTTISSPTPIPVFGISTATAISAGYAHACALLSGGTVKCWGYNHSGQLGDGTTTNRSTPVSVVF